jgi:lactoylglutathione lyase
MENTTKTKSNVRQAVPMFAVSDIEESIKFYIDGLGFDMVNKWVPRGKIEWCWLQLGDAALMLQEFLKEGPDSYMPSGKVGEGVTINFICGDALSVYHEILLRGIEVSEPFVGNNMWVIGVTDPDGYRLYFESDTDVPEETKYSEWKK